MNYKIVKVYGILDDLLNKYKNDKQFGKSLKNPFMVKNILNKNINSSIELLQRIGNDNQCVGILMCFKFFKSISKSNVFKISQQIYEIHKETQKE